ncbi:hypothetical protein C0995_013374 [Termitomyces sp. Mi166|nr:hypothetical protein C0995_013374 [Termitomyces sp. Mi166\
MLVTVVPLTTNVQLAAVVFSILFEDLDPTATPSTWTTQLQSLRLDELEVPALVHALDKSTRIICLLEEVTFDLSTSTISCHFVDGSVEQWPFVGEQCIKVLDRIVQDVNESSLALEREKEEKRERRRFEMPRSPPTKASGHKKQRSLLMSLVASIIPLYSPSNSRLPSPLPTPIIEKKLSPAILPRDRRRRARSDLVDAFRRYVLSELSRRFPRGGYTTWIVQSMLRRATETMEYLIKEARGSTDSGSGHLHHFDGDESVIADLLPPTPSVSDDDDETIFTDTDGSSVHTPTSLHVSFAPVLAKRHSYVSQSPRRLLSENNYVMYAQHAALADRLRRLAMVDQDRQDQEAEELKQHHRMLEIQSRRRAWLNRTLIGGVRSQHADIRMSMVFNKSPLARYSWSSEEYEHAPEPIQSIRQRQEYEEYDKMHLKTKRSQRCMMTPKLFPVSEDDEDVDDTVLDARELEFEFEDFEIDLEAGMQCDNSGVSPDNGPGIALAVPFEIERPQLRTRLRTSSMRKHRFRVSSPAGLEHERLLSPQLTASSNLCQSLPSVGQNPSRDDLSPSVYTEVDVNLNISQVEISGYGGFDKCAEDEFTLAMDLPISVRCEDHENLTNERGLNFGSNRSWYSSRVVTTSRLRKSLSVTGD